VDTELLTVPSPKGTKAKLTGGQKCLIASLIVLQVPFSLLFYPLAALFALTGIGVPISMLFMGIGSMPFTSAMKRKTAWQSSPEPTSQNPE
jgi:hypothetical protein